MWTFGKRIAAGFALAAVFFMAIGVVSYRGLTLLANTSYLVRHTHEVLAQTNLLISIMKDAESGQRGYIITGDESFLEPYRPAAADAERSFAELRRLTADNPAQQRRLDQVEPLIAAKFAELKRTIELRRASQLEQAVKIVQGSEGKRYMDDLRRIVGAMEAEEVELRKQRADDVENVTRTGKATVLYGTLLCLAIVSLAGWLITRALTVQIGSAVQHVQSSSAELQASANQQASGAKESSTAMAEITTTISELLATSRQIAESAQRVAQIAQDTATAANAGDRTAQKTQESVHGIKRQVDVIVTHMLDLGRKSQQIGGVLEIINELAEQTNILAINATIEAAGAGEGGKRFAVVADEIRKLADRVGTSTKEIRSLIEEIRGAVNTTVMATESGSKAVELGSRQFADVAVALQQIGALVGTTAEAAREIQLSTKQQSTAVEQVNLAVANVAKATQESEASSSQTLQTSTQLSMLSRELSRMVQPQA